MQKRRKEWEARTGYKEKQRKAAAYRRAEQSERVRASEKIASEKRTEAVNARIAEQKKQRYAELQKKAEDGDKWSRLWLALYNGDMLEYWKLRRNLHIDADEKTGHVSNCIVGGINVYEDGFEYKVMESCEK